MPIFVSISTSFISWFLRYLTRHWTITSLGDFLLFFQVSWCSNAYYFRFGCTANSIVYMSIRFEQSVKIYCSYASSISTFLHSFSWLRWKFHTKQNSVWTEDTAKETHKKNERILLSKKGNLSLSTVLNKELHDFLAQVNIFRCFRRRASIWIFVIRDVFHAFELNINNIKNVIGVSEDADTKPKHERERPRKEARQLEMMILPLCGVDPNTERQPKNVRLVSHSFSFVEIK